MNIWRDAHFQELTGGSGALGLSWLGKENIFFDLKNFWRRWYRLGLPIWATLCFILITWKRWHICQRICVQWALSILSHCNYTLFRSPHSFIFCLVLKILFPLHNEPEQASFFFFFPPPSVVLNNADFLPNRIIHINYSVRTALALSKIANPNPPRANSAERKWHIQWTRWWCSVCGCSGNEWELSLPPPRADAKGSIWGRKLKLH